MTTRAGAPCFKSVEEQVGEQERRQMAEGDGALQPAGGDMAGCSSTPDVADQHLDPRKALEDLAGQPPHLQLGGRSAANTSTGPLPSALSSPAASSVLSGSRPQIARSAPILAGPRAVALPIPPLAPVTSTVLPAIGPLWSCPVIVLRGRRFRR